MSMSRTEILLYVFLGLLIAFLLGWVARWIYDRLSRSEEIASEEAMERMHAAEHALELREHEFSATEAQYANSYAQLEAELQGAMTGLGDARRELRELRAQLPQ